LDGLFHGLEHHFHPEVTVRVHVDLVAIVPVELHHLFEFPGLRDPFAVMTVIDKIRVAVLELGQLGVNRPVGKYLDGLW